MSRQGNCHDNTRRAFFIIAKKGRVKRKVYKTRNEARTEIFNYIEYFYHPVRHHTTNNGLSLMKFDSSILRT